MKEMYIPCKTVQEKQEVIKHLVSLGYIDEDTGDHYLNLRTHEDDCIQSVVDNRFGKLEVVTPQQLLNKQEPTMNKLKEAVQNSGFSKSELSRRLGKHRNYLGEMLRVGCSTKKQNELIEMINQVKAGERFKSDDEIIADLSEQLEKSQQLAQHNADCAHKYLEQAKQQEAIAEHNNKNALRHLSNFEQMKANNAELEEKANRLSESAKQLTIQAGELSRENIKLAGELKDERKNAQNQAQRILDLEAIIAPQNKEIIELRATKDTLEYALTDAGEELLKQDGMIDEKNVLIKQRNDEIILLNKENSELNKQRKSYMSAFFYAALIGYYLFFMERF
ncbi:hypothetical protein [Acinetobacter phage HFM1]|nr:hypothetical protein [Acinetobacter phage HFM1]